MRSNRAAVALSIFFLAPFGFGQHNTRPPRIYDLKNVEWHLSFDETLGTIDGDVTNTLSPLRPNTKEVWFDSVKLNIKKATVNGAPAKVRSEGERIFVTLPKSSGPKDNLAVRLQYTGRPEAGIYFIPAQRAFPAHTSVVYTQGEMIDTRYWLPTYDNPDDKATSESFVTVPSDYTVITNGKLIGVKPEGKMKVVHYRMDVPHSTYLISLVTGKYETGADGSFDGKPVRWNVPQGLSDMGKAAFGGTDKMIAVYSKLTGINYPYPKFDQSAVPDYMFGGMENISAVTQTIGALFPPSAAPVMSSEGLVLHELAHQWFGDDITCADWSNAWLNEGFATFLPSFYVRAAHGQEAYDLSRYGTLQGGFFASNEGRPVVWTGYQEPIDEFGGSIYPGGASRMFVLMHMLGEDRFWKAINSYLKEYQFKPVTTPQFFASVGKAAGVDLTQFMNEWFYRTGIPKISVKRDGKDLLIDQAKPYFTLDLPVWILNGTNWVKKSVHSADAEVRLPLGDLAGKPVLVDPEVYLLSSINYDYTISPEDYMAMYRNAPNAAARALMQRKMTSVLSSEQSEALAKEEKNDDLLPSLLNKVDDIPYLLELTKSEDAKIVNSAAGALQGKSLDDAAMTRLNELFTTSPNPAIQQTAMRVLLDTKAADDIAAKAWTMPSWNDTFRSSALRYYAKTAPDKARELALGVLANPDSEALRRTAIQQLGGLKDKPGEHRVFDALVKVVQERSFGARNDAINALATYGNKAAAQYIRPLTDNSMVFTRRTAQGALQQLGG